MSLKIARTGRQTSLDSRRGILQKLRRMIEIVGGPRKLTPAVRADLGLPQAPHAPYRWAFASLMVAIVCVPLMLASLWTACVAAAGIGLVILPTVRWFENRDAAWRENVYRFGKECTGRVLDVEPAAAPGGGDHIVRVEFRTDAAVVRASVMGCPLARRGLMPDDEVAVLYAPDRPTRCLLVRKVTREIVDAIFDD
jgi:hypothetical protein